jgi:hypothetical protein
MNEIVENDVRPPAAIVGHEAAAILKKAELQLATRLLATAERLKWRLSYERRLPATSGLPL